MRSDADDRMARMFRHFATKEFAGASPLYERLSDLAAQRLDLTAPLLAAPLGQQRALLYFAAVSYVLRTTDPAHPLASWYPSLGGTRSAADGDPGAALADLVGSHVEELTTICRTRTTQTNEASRAALLRPAFGYASSLLDARPLALIELGTSAGLLLVPDRYSYRYHRDGHLDRAERVEVYGDGLRLDCETLGDGWPEPAGVPLRIASRTGIDLSPIRADDADGVNWLRSCIWPEHVARVKRLDAALVEVAAAAPRLVAGDFLDALPAVLSTVDADVVPCVFTSHALMYLTADERAGLVRMLHATGLSRDLIVIVNEAAMCGAQLFAPDVPTPPTTPSLRAPITVVTWRDGTASVEVLAEGGPHGAWLDYRPHRYAYHPPALD